MIRNNPSFFGILCSCGSPAESWISRLMGKPQLFIKCSGCGKKGVVQQQKLEDPISQEIYGSKIVFQELKK